MEAVADWWNEEARLGEKTKVREREPSNQVKTFALKAEENRSSLCKLMEQYMKPESFQSYQFNLNTVTALPREKEERREETEREGGGRKT